MTVRALEMSDLPFLYRWENDAAVWADSDTHNPLSQRLLREFIDNSTGDIYKDGQLRLIIEDDGAVAGCVDLFDLDVRNRRACVGLYVAPEHRGKGLATETMRWLLTYARETLHLHQLYAIIRVNNEACCHMYEKLHFSRTSELHDWVWMPDGRFENARMYQKTLTNA